MSEERLRQVESHVGDLRVATEVTETKLDQLTKALDKLTPAVEECTAAINKGKGALWLVGIGSSSLGGLAGWLAATWKGAT